MVYEIKFRFKGEERIERMPTHWIPEVLLPSEDDTRNGIDLTRYSVIYATFGRRGDERAVELHKKAPGVILAYRYEWHNGWGGGIFLPENFNPSRVEYFKTQEQLEIEKKEHLRLKSVALAAEINDLAFPVKAEAFSDTGGVEIFLSGGKIGVGSFTTHSVEHFKGNVLSWLSFKDEWVARGIAAYDQYNIPAEARANTFWPYPSKGGSCFGLQFYNLKAKRAGHPAAANYIVFQKDVNGQWSVTGIADDAPHAWGSTISFKKLNPGWWEEMFTNLPPSQPRSDGRQTTIHELLEICKAQRTPIRWKWDQIPLRDDTPRNGKWRTLTNVSAETQRLFPSNKFITAFNSCGSWTWSQVEMSIEEGMKEILAADFYQLSTDDDSLVFAPPFMSVEDAEALWQRWK